MSSIEEKLNTLREIQESLDDFQRKLKKDQDNIEEELSRIKNQWNDSQMEAFRGKYVEKFKNDLDTLQQKLLNAAIFIDHKYSTLETHRN